MMDTYQVLMLLFAFGGFIIAFIEGILKIIDKNTDNKNKKIKINKKLCSLSSYSGFTIARIFKL